MQETFLNKVLEGQREAYGFITHTLPENHNDDHIIQFFRTLEQSTAIANSAIAEKIADYYQLLNDKSNYSRVSLNDIATIYEEVLKMRPFDISLYESAFYFFKNVLDEEAKANTILKNGISMIQSRITGLQAEMD